MVNIHETHISCGDTGYFDEFDEEIHVWAEEYDWCYNRKYEPCFVNLSTIENTTDREHNEERKCRIFCVESQCCAQPRKQKKFEAITS